MKNIFFAFLIVFAIISACNPPKTSTGTSSDSTTNHNTSDTSVSTQRDSSMHK